MNNNKPASRKSNVVEQELEKELLIYDLTINKAFCLNQTSALVYNLATTRGGNGSSTNGCRYGCFCRSASAASVANGACG